MKMDEKGTEGARGCWEIPISLEQGQGRSRECWNQKWDTCLECKHTHCCGELVAAPELRNPAQSTWTEQLCVLLGYTVQGSLVGVFSSCSELCIHLIGHILY